MVVKAQPACRHCGATLRHSWSKCPRCGKRSWTWLFAGFGRRT